MKPLSMPNNFHIVDVVKLILQLTEHHKELNFKNFD